MRRGQRVKTCTDNVHRPVFLTALVDCFSSAAVSSILQALALRKHRPAVYYCAVVVYGYIAKL